MSALRTWAPSAASQESKAPEAVTHAEGSTSKAGGVGPVTAALPLGAPGTHQGGQPARSGDLVVVDEDEGVGSAGLAQGAVASGHDARLGLVDVDQPRRRSRGGRISLPGRLRRLRLLSSQRHPGGLDNGPRPGLRVIVHNEYARRRPRVGDVVGLRQQLGDHLREVVVAAVGEHRDGQVHVQPRPSSRLLADRGVISRSNGTITNRVRPTAGAPEPRRRTPVPSEARRPQRPTSPAPLRDTAPHPEGSCSDDRHP